MTGNDVTWFQVIGGDPQVTSFYRKSPGSGSRRPKTPVYCTLQFLQGCSSQEEAVRWQEMTSRDLRWPEVTRKWRQLIGSHKEVVVESQKLPHTVHFTPCKAVARRRRQSHDRKWRDVTSGDWKWRYLTGSQIKIALGQTLAYTVHFTSYKAVACKRRQSRDRKRQHVTSNDQSDPEWRHLTRSHLKVAVENQKLTYTVHFTSSSL